MTRHFLNATMVALAAFIALAPTPSHAQMTAAELVVRLDRLEAQVRQLTGLVEQLQYRNQQLEQQLRRGPEDTDARLNERGVRPGAIQPRPAAAPPAMPPSQAAPPQAPPGALPRRSDVFDPNDHPGAPGTPRALGSVPPVAPPPGSVAADDDQGVGVPRGRRAGAPLDLSTLSSQAAEDPSLAPGPAVARQGEIRTIPGVLPPPPPRNPNATGQQMVMAPSNTPKDEFDLAHGYVLHKDYALAEEALRAFLKKYPSDRLVADANYWLGESLFQRQRYRDAAELFLAVSTKFESSGKAPEALLRLGQSLAALKEKEGACAALGEVGRRYPKAAASVRNAAEREQKRHGC
jgi:tol-pal system protein YbgF